MWAKNGQKNAISTLLYNSLAEAAPRLGVEFTEGEPFEYGSLCPSEAPKEKQRETNRLTSSPDSLQVNMQTFRNRIDFRQSNRSAEFIRGDEDEDEQSRYIRQGRLLHHLFATIRTKDDVLPTLQAMLSEGLFASAEDAERARKLVDKALARPEAEEWFGGTWELFNECSIIYMEHGELQTRRPDRVMIRDGEVVVVDFKFGKPGEAYNEQVRGYMDLLHDMGYTRVKGYLW